MPKGTATLLKVCLMRRIIKIALSIVFFSTLASANLRIGYVNSEMILSRYKAVEKAKESVTKLKNEWSKELNQKQRTIDQLKSELQKEALVTSNATKQLKEQEILDSIASYQTYLDEKFGPTGLLAEKEQAIMQSPLKKIERIINKIAIKDDYDFIFDSRVGMLHGKNVYDLTEKVLNALNSRK